MEIKPFRVRVDETVLDDLALRLARSRFARPSDPVAWRAGTDPFYLSELLTYWRHRFDWRAVEHRLNRLPQFMADDLHVVHARGNGPAPFPLLMIHGHLSSFAEMTKILPLLTDPPDPADAFDVIIPSVPGSVFSPLPHGVRPDTPWLADRMADLMTGLGHLTFGTYGTEISHWLAARHPRRVAGVHLTSPSPRAPSRPDTVAAALIDSPAGLAAWLLDELRTRTDCDGELETRWTKDELLTLTTLYWTTSSIGTALGVDHHAAADPPLPICTVPAAFTLSTTAAPPRRHLYPDIRLRREPKRGGHFMPFEEPELLAEDLRAFFRPLRPLP
ncbi:epoxide hydrolase family protein [Actinoplanes sp. NBRC 103695]|uniref:epoxide hydrolase family protein n=1 Tax=Actinoplanes sp. NBRC 103695 TaxID=3032202 RepID=UPI0024A4C647|nr:epoxide hydrolase family protein [Actinoplanes sp. NBRC 103695]GLY98421.1 microsomal epoxide hydrolase [Actinoplanes sp. NBRC 103695]